MLDATTSKNEFYDLRRHPRYTRLMHILMFPLLRSVYTHSEFHVVSHMRQDKKWIDPIFVVAAHLQHVTKITVRVNTPFHKKLCTNQHVRKMHKIKHVMHVHATCTWVGKCPLH
jgi:hypothetical protein